MDVVQEFEKQVRVYSAHVFRARRQQAALRMAKSNTTDASRVVVHCDYSENYVGKTVTAVQATHFGAHPQIVIHQGIYYVNVRKRTVLRELKRSHGSHMNVKKIIYCVTFLCTNAEEALSICNFERRHDKDGRGSVGTPPPRVGTHQGSPSICNPCDLRD